MSEAEPVGGFGHGVLAGRGSPPAGGSGEKGLRGPLPVSRGFWDDIAQRSSMLVFEVSRAMRL